MQTEYFANQLPINKIFSTNTKELFEGQYLHQPWSNLTFTLRFRAAKSQKRVMGVYFHLNKGVVSIPDWHLENYANFRSFDFATEISLIFPLNGSHFGIS